MLSISFVNLLVADWMCENRLAQCFRAEILVHRLLKPRMADWTDWTDRKINNARSRQIQNGAESSLLEVYFTQAAILVLQRHIRTDWTTTTHLWELRYM